MTEQYSSFSVNRFNSEIQNTGVFRPYHFLVIMTPPTNPYIQELFDVRSMSLRVESTALPMRAIRTIDQQYYGPMRRIPYKYDSMPLRMSVILSETTKERELFSRWQDMLVGRSRTQNEVQNKSLGFDSHYYKEAAQGCSIQILAFAESPKFQGDSNRTVFDEVGDIARAFGFDPSVPIGKTGLSSLFPGIRDQKVEPVLEVKFHEVYPIDVQEMNLDWGETNSYGKLQLQFNYRYYTENYTSTKKESSSFLSATNLFKARNALGIIRNVGGTANQVIKNIGL